MVSCLCAGKSGEVSKCWVAATTFVDGFSLVCLFVCVPCDLLPMKSTPPQYVMHGIASQ